jgi:hypothetical protein
MKRIFKYKLEPTDYQILKIPVGSSFLSAQSQKDDIVLYALVDDLEVENDNLHIIIHGTGHDASDLGEHSFLGTVKLYDDTLMFHVFYKKL